jgi:xanthine dehydrogenase accessory factor
LEIYVEPYLPKPQLVLVGHGPVVETLATLGQAADFAVVALTPDTWPAGLEQHRLTEHCSVVVATHADSDEQVLESVLRTVSSYVSLVASRRRAAVILERLEKLGVPAERRGRLKAPAGLDIGAVTPEEIAVSILAEIIQHRRSDKTQPRGRATAAPVARVGQKICGMMVDSAAKLIGVLGTRCLLLLSPLRRFDRIRSGTARPCPVPSEPPALVAFRRR